MRTENILFHDEPQLLHNEHGNTSAADFSASSKHRINADIPNPSHTSEVNLIYLQQQLIIYKDKQLGRLMQSY